MEISLCKVFIYLIRRIGFFCPADNWAFCHPISLLKSQGHTRPLPLLPSYLDLTVLVYFLPKLVEDAAADGGAAAADDPGAGEMLLGDGRVHGQHHHQGRN